MTTADIIALFNLHNYKQGNILQSEKRVFMLPLSIYFRKHSCLQRAFDRQIGKYTANGLISTWAKLFRPPKYKKTNKNPIIQMSFGQVNGIFIISLILYAFSVIIFLFELASLKIKFIRKVLDFMS